MTLGNFSPATPNALRLMAELEFVNELCQVVASKTELQPILDWIVQKTTGMFRADEGSIRLLSPDSEEPTLKTRVRAEQPGLSSGSWPRVIATNIMGYLMSHDEPLAAPDLLNDPRFVGLRGFETHIRAVLAVPLKIGNRFTGVLAVTHREPGRVWKQDEVQLLMIVGANSASVIEQARLRVEAEDKKRLQEERKLADKELVLAQDIQMSLLPRVPLRSGPWQVCGRVVPARQVGGDAFDYYPLPDGRSAVSIADVSGKGVPAALLMSNLQASLRGFRHGRGSISEVMDLANQNVTQMANGKFVTVFLAEFDHTAGVLRYARAAHEYPLLRRKDGTIEELKVGGFPLGIALGASDAAGYAEAQVQLEPGDSLLLYSDGITDAEDMAGKLFGIDRLRDLWQKHGALAPGAVIDVVLAEVQRFRGPALQSDDMTLVVLGAHPES